MLAYVHAYICIHTHNEKPGGADTYIHTRTYKHTYIHRYIHTYTHNEKPAGADTHIHIHTYIHTYINTHTMRNLLEQTHAYTYIHTYIHTYTHTYIHTYTYTHTKRNLLEQTMKSTIRRDLGCPIGSVLYPRQDVLVAGRPLRAHLGADLKLCVVCLCVCVCVCVCVCRMSFSQGAPCGHTLERI
jgi:hypothetical protein